MNIILGKDHYEKFKDQFILLELDTLVINGEPMPSYCVLDAKKIPLTEMPDILHWQKNHNKIMENYHKRNFAFVEQMIEHCQNRWGGELESFYIDLFARTQKYKNQKLDNSWTGYIEKD
jgi:hypothetical protein